MINYYDLVKNDPHYFKQFSCKGLLFLNYDCPVKEKKAAKWSEHHYVYYVLSGQKTLHTTESSITLTKGSIAFIRKGACVVEQFFDEPFCIVVFIIPDSFIVSFLNEFMPNETASGTTIQPIIPIYDNERIKAFYDSVLPYFSSNENIPEPLVELKFKELLLHIVNGKENSDLRNYLLTLRTNTSPIKDIMEANYAYNLSLEDYARLTNRSLSSFKRDFQSIYKTTPGKWLTEKRLERTKNLLISTNDSVSEIAFLGGFENLAHFSKLFKSKNGVSPLQYRKQHQAAMV